MSDDVTQITEIDVVCANCDSIFNVTYFTKLVNRSQPKFCVFCGSECDTFLALDEETITGDIELYDSDLDA